MQDVSHVEHNVMIMSLVKAQQHNVTNITSVYDKKTKNDIPRYDSKENA